MSRNKLLGAIIGDICGSSYELDRFKRLEGKATNPTDIELVLSSSTFTDDTVCTIAIADALLHGKVYADSLVEWCRKYRDRGYGWNFGEWIDSDFQKPYGSYGNGAAMRVSPVGWVAKTIEECDLMAASTCACSHNSPEAIIGASAIAESVLLISLGATRESLYGTVLNRYYPEFCKKSLDDIRKNYSFDVTCQGSVPHAILCFIESKSYKHCLQLAISLGGDSDTIACMAGGIANAYYNYIPEDLLFMAYNTLPEDMIQVIEEFDKM